MPKAKKVSQIQTSTRPKRTTTTIQAASTATRPEKKQPKPTVEPEESSGTGFKNAAAAKTTILTIAHRSLTYQYQTISTLYNRATHHPHHTVGIDAALAVFQEWIEVTYPAAKSNLRGRGGFKPLLSKEILSKYLPLMKKKLSKEESRFAEVYVGLRKGKRLGNILVDEKKDNGGDWESERYRILDKLVPAEKEEKSGWKDGQLWNGKEPTVEHLKVIAWAWSPVPGRTLLSK
jgi:hypothetical protein